MRQPGWDKYETVLLIEAYWKIKADYSQKGTVVAALSSLLREKAGSEIEDVFRNENGINMRLAELEYLFSGGEVGLKNTSGLFREMVELYLNNREGFEQILSEAKGVASNALNVRRQFCEWIEEKAPKLRPEAVCQSLEIGEEFCKKLAILTLPLFETTDIGTIKKFVKTVTNNKIFRIRNKKQYVAIVNAANWYYAFIRSLPDLDELKPKATIPKEDNQPNISVSAKEELPSDNAEPESTQSGNFDTDFFEWLLNVEGMAARTCQSYVSALHFAESFAKEHKLNSSILCTMDSDVALSTASALMQNVDFRQLNRTQHNRFSAAFNKLNKFFAYLYPDKFGMPVLMKRSNNVVREEKTPELAPKALVVLVDKLIHDADNGITKAEICKKSSKYGTHQVNLAITACHPVLVLKKYYHRENISDYQEMADILLEVILRQFSQNGGYTSAQQLYNEARVKLDDFFFYNNAFNSRQEVFDLAVHLFDQEKYKGNSFIFVSNMHIWKEGPDYPKDYHGLLIKYAREHGNTFSRENAVSYFEQIGSPSPAPTFSNVLLNTGSKSFLQYAENQFVLNEALGINEYFLTSVKTQIENLLEGEDYIAIGEIDDYFYTTLPTLPVGIYWSALLLEDVLRICEIGFATIEAGKESDKKTLPAAIVRKDSPFKAFSDVVWNEVSKSFPLPKEFTASEFREFLRDKGFIRGHEKMGSVHKTVAGDIRFYWTEQNGRVTIN